MAFTSITVTGTFQDPTGAGMAGTAVFLLSEPLFDSTAHQVREPVPVTATITAGALSQALTANDDTTTLPTGTYYVVTLNLKTAAGAVIPEQVFNVTVPRAAQGGVFDLSLYVPPPELHP